jgi:hypothetical protein
MDGKTTLPEKINARLGAPSALSAVIRHTDDSDADHVIVDGMAK